MNVSKKARKDAAEYAAAYVAHGEGAGTRRRLIRATVDHRASTIPGYLAAFNEAILEQDMAKLASDAKRARKVKDIGNSVSKNAKGLVTRDYRSVNGGVLIVLGIAYVAHKTGYDKKAYAWSKRKYQDFRHGRLMSRVDEVLKGTSEE